VRWFVLVLGLALTPAVAQEVPKKKNRKSTAAAKAHQKPTAEQIRRFNELQKKQQ
jgi:hypothetical protein